MTAPLKKEMAELSAKGRIAAFGSDDWIAVNNRLNELLSLWAAARINHMVEDLKHSRM